VLRKRKKNTKGILREGERALVSGWSIYRKMAAHMGPGEKENFCGGVTKKYLGNSPVQRRGYPEEGL